MVTMQNRISACNLYNPGFAASVVLPLPKVDDLVINPADGPSDSSTAQSPIEEAHNSAPPSDRVANEVVGE